MKEATEKENNSRTGSERGKTRWWVAVYTASFPVCPFSDGAISPGRISVSIEGDAPRALGPGARDLEAAF